MKIQYIERSINVESTGGHSFSLDLIASKMANRGHNVSILTTESNKNNIPNDKPYTIERLDGGTRPKTAKNLYSHIKQADNNVDLFHIFQPAFHPIAGYYKKNGGDTPIVGRLNDYAMFCTNPHMMNGHCHQNCSIRDKYSHDAMAEYKKPLRIPEYSFRQFVTPKLIKYVDKLFAISPQIKEIYEANGVPKEKIEVIPNFYDPDFTVTTSVPHRNSTTNILYVGRLANEKGVDLLIESINKLYQIDSFNFSVDIIGKGPQRKKLEKMIYEMSLSDIVNMHGEVSHGKLPQYYAKSDLFVHPGRWPEPFGRTILEALQHNTPLIVSNIGAPPWIVGNAGRNFEPGNTDKLAEEIFHYMKNPNERHYAQSRCAEQLKKFHPDRIVPLLERQYELVSHKI